MVEALYNAKKLFHADAGIRMPWSVSTTRGSGIPPAGGVSD